METQLRDRDEKLSTLLADKNALDEELKRLRAEIAAAKKASTTNQIPTTIPSTNPRHFYRPVAERSRVALEITAIASLKYRDAQRIGKGFTVTLNCHSI
jgi:hypothetical protein